MNDFSTLLLLTMDNQDSALAREAKHIHITDNLMRTLWWVSLLVILNYVMTAGLLVYFLSKG